MSIDMELTPKTKRPNGSGPCCEPVVYPDVDRDHALRMAEVAKALGDPIRLQLVDVLRRHAGKVCVHELIPLFDVAQPTISHHLKKLRDAGIVDSERQGLWAYYYVVPGALDELGRGSSSPRATVDVVVVGAGQSGLAVGYYLRRTDLSYVLLDASPAPGGAWSATWPSLRLFSPAEASSLPGRLMRSEGPGYPGRDVVVDYLTQYEERYGLAVRRSVLVHAVRRRGEAFTIETDTGDFEARAVISATGTASAPYVPEVPGRGSFAGRQVHSVDYRGPGSFAGQRVGIVGAGNSAAQILAEVSRVADALWFVRESPHFMPDDVDGRAIFVEASRRYREGGGAVHDLGDIVMVPSVKEARDRGALRWHTMFDRVERHGAAWNDGTFEALDAVIWCTGFRPALEHLAPLGVVGPDGRVAVDGTRAQTEPKLWLVGYGGWTGFASATLIGVGRSARRTVEEVEIALAASGG